MTARHIPNQDPDALEVDDVERALAMTREPDPALPNASPAVALAAIQAARAAILEGRGAGSGQGRKPRWVKPARDLEPSPAVDLEQKGEVL